MPEEKKKKLGLSENAYRALQPGEKYEPIVHAEARMVEVSFRSVLFGLVMAVVFSGAAAFLGLKIGQVFEAAIPIAIIAVGSAGLFKRKSTILENVIIQSIGACSGMVVAGAIFTLPAIYILNLEATFFELVAASFLGGCLGVFLLILFRKYFVHDMHGKLPFPEGTATTEILVSGDSGGKDARILTISMLIGAGYDFCVYTLNLINERFNSEVFHWGKTLSNKSKVVFNMNLTAAVAGLGYIIGLRYSAIICAGSFLSFYALIPLIGHFASPAIANAGGGTFSPDYIFTNYVRLIGIGGIACAGVIGIIKTSKIIKDAIVLGIKEIFFHKHEEGEAVVRTNHDIHMKFVFIGLVTVVAALLCLFGFFVLNGFSNVWFLAIVALLIVVVISFLFTPVAARAIAVVGSNPVSGMTLMTLIICSIILIKCGLTGNAGIVAALIIGGVVCTALSCAGSFITDLKVGYWIGATPRNQERFKFLGMLISAFTVCLVIILLNKTYGFHIDEAHPDALVAPQANAMAAVIKTLMSSSPIPWTLYGAGIAIAIVCEMCGVPPLAFALGMYLPLGLNTPLLFGAFIGFLVKKSSSNEKISKRRQNRGTLIASGLIAGGAIIGVVGALIKYVGLDKSFLLRGIIIPRGESATHDTMSLIAYFALAVFIYLYARGTKKTTEEVEE